MNKHVTVNHAVFLKSILKSESSCYKCGNTLDKDFKLKDHVHVDHEHFSMKLNVTIITWSTFCDRKGILTASFRLLLPHLGAKDPGHRNL